MLLERLNVGIDIVEISRFKKKPYASNKNFYKKIFSDEEISYCLKFTDDYRHFAGKFAIKEATLKATKMKISMLDIITSHLYNSPTVKINILSDQSLQTSVSHDGSYAIAIVISEKIS